MEVQPLALVVDRGQEVGLLPTFVFLGIMLGGICPQLSSCSQNHPQHVRKIVLAGHRKDRSVRGLRRDLLLEQIRWILLDVLLSCFLVLLRSSLTGDARLVHLEE